MTHDFSRASLIDNQGDLNLPQPTNVTDVVSEEAISRTWLLERRSSQITSMFARDPFEERGRKLWSQPLGSLQVSCHRSIFDPECKPFKRRRYRFIVSDGATQLAAATFITWAAPHFIDDTFDFFEYADAVSQTDMELADAVNSVWPNASTPLNCGEVVLFDRLAIPTPHREVWHALNSAIDKTFKPSGAILVLKAFPLEWENGGPLAFNVDGTKLFERRLKAMKELYRRRLGVETLLPSPQDPRWMWKPLRQGVVSRTNEHRAAIIL